MHRVLVLGAGKIGSLIACLLAGRATYDVHLGDISIDGPQHLVEGLDLARVTPCILDVRHPAPGTLKVRLVQGAVTVRATATRDVVINVDSMRRGPAPRGPAATADGRGGPPANRRDASRDGNRDASRHDGLRRLDQPAGLDVEEADNVMTISAPPMDRSILTIEAPARTSLQISVISGGGITIEGIEGDIEANNVNGPVTLTNVAGGAVAHSVNGGVTASLRQAGRSPMAFTSLNGEIDVTLPPATKANLKLRADRGEIYTDFDVQPTAPPVRTAERTRAFALAKSAPPIRCSGGASPPTYWRIASIWSDGM